MEYSVSEDNTVEVLREKAQNAISNHPDSEEKTRVDSIRKTFDAFYALNQYSSGEDESDLEEDKISNDDGDDCPTVNPEIQPLSLLAIDPNTLRDLSVVGKISSIITCMVVVESDVPFEGNVPALDTGTVLFLHDKRPIGVISELFGPIKKPYYSIEYNSHTEVHDLKLAVGIAVYFAPKSKDWTKFIFKNQIPKDKPCDAEDVDEECQFFSDDEEERKAIIERKLKLQEAKEQKIPRAPKKGPTDNPDCGEGKKQKKSKQERRIITKAKLLDASLQLEGLGLTHREPTKEEILEREAIQEIIRTAQGENLDEKDEMNEQAFGSKAGQSKDVGYHKSVKRDRTSDTNTISDQPTNVTNDNPVTVMVNEAMKNDPNMANQIMSLFLKKDLKKKSSANPPSKNKIVDTRFVQNNKDA